MGDRAFNEIKQSISADVTLAHFDPNLQTVAACDASLEGIGAVLTQIRGNEERPVVFISRTLTKAERNYGTIDKEGLAMFYTIKKLYQYLKGIYFKILTDHKPLFTLLNENKNIPLMAASRMQRWSYSLSGFDYTIEYRKGEGNANADFLSRFPLVNKSEGQDADEISYLNYINLKELPVDYKAIRMHSARDIIVPKVIDCLKSGNSIELIGDEFKPYRIKTGELAVEQDILYTQNLRRQTLELIHITHQGIVETKTLARSYFW